MAQWIERPPSKRKVAGSSPAVGKLSIAQMVERQTVVVKRYLLVTGSIPVAEKTLA